jgi:putative thiamine transport system substrate-binding protein
MIFAKMRRGFAVLAVAAIGLLSAGAQAQDWPAAVARARGQTVYLNAWGGSEKINAYLAWAASRVAADYGVTLRHVKLDDTASAVARLVAEKAAGREAGGTIDLIWINGENFAALKDKRLLFGPFAERLPNFRFVDTAGKPSTLVDFTLAVEGLEAPWGMAQIVFMHDSAREPSPPRTLSALLAWAKAHPGRLTYPQPPDFLGTTFLKQALIGLAPDKTALARPATDASFAAQTGVLWAWLDELTPALWRRGQAYPANQESLRQLLDDGEIDLAFSFEPAGASAAIEQGLLPKTVRTYVLDGGTIGNTHFLAIPWNANAKEGAQVVADFLLSPEAQAHKQDPRVWGDFTVLDLARLAPPDRRRFDALPRGIATLPPEALGPTLLEPHPSWTTRLADEWRRRRLR